MEKLENRMFIFGFLLILIAIVIGVAFLSDTSFLIGGIGIMAIGIGLLVKLNRNHE